MMNAWMASSESLVISTLFFSKLPGSHIQYTSQTTVWGVIKILKIKRDQPQRNSSDCQCVQPLA